MSHRAAAAHLRVEVCGTARFETGRLVDPDEPALFGAVRGVLCDIDYVAALRYGWTGSRHRDIASRAKTVRFIREMFAEAACDQRYERFAAHLYELFRVGTVHHRSPKILHADGQDCSTPALTWALSYDETAPYDVQGETYVLTHLVPQTVVKKIADFYEATMLPVSIKRLFDDFLAACELFARQLDHEEHDGGQVLLDQWNSAARGLVSPEPNRHLVW